MKITANGVEIPLLHDGSLNFAVAMDGDETMGEITVVITGGRLRVVGKSAAITIDGLFTIVAEGMSFDEKTRQAEA